VADCTLVELFLERLQFRVQQATLVNIEEVVLPRILVIGDVSWLKVKMRLGLDNDLSGRTLTV
jgi:hypothetical protein